MTLQLGAERFGKFIEQSLSAWRQSLSFHSPGKRQSKPVRTPTVLQMEAVECGAASLAIILGYYGRFEPLENLRTACGVSRDGSKAHNILKAARAYGLVGKGFKKELEDLERLRFPVIVFWKFGHFLIVNGFAKNRVLLNDPATGPRTVTREEFDQGYTGVVLTFEKGPLFSPGGKQPWIWRSLGKRLPGSGLAVGYIALCTLALAVPNLIIPAFSKVYIDSVLIRGMQNWLRPLLIAMLLVIITKAVLTALQQSTLFRLEIKLALSSSSKFFWHVLRLPMTFFAHRMSGEITSRIDVNDRVAVLLSGEVATNLANIALIGLYAALLFRYNVGLTFLGLGVSILNLAALQFVSRRRIDVNHKLLQEQGKMFGTAVMGLQSIDTLKATGAESDFFSRWAGHQAKVVNAQQELGLSSVFLSAVPPFLTSINSLVIITFGAIQVMDGLLTAGMLIAFQSLMASVTEPVNKLVDLGGKLQEAQGGLSRLEDVFNYEPDPHVVQPISDEAAIERIEGDLELRDVTFGYSRLEPPLLKRFSLRIRPGERVALVGASGSGKSTVSKIASGLFEAWSGEVCVDGRIRTDISRSTLEHSIALVDQDVFLFEGTVAQNLTMWNASVSEEVLVEAAKDACIYDDITNRPKGFESTILEGGRNFGGGQRQRLELARALVIQPRILILDEATSVLDAETEKIIDNNLRRRGCTCLIVAHRLSTIRDCDEIIVLDRGEVAQRGTHETLLHQPGPYAELIRSV